MRKFIFILMAIIASVTCIYAQDTTQVAITVTGIVLDEQQEPLQGVTVTVKDQPGLGISTNGKGEYTVKANKYQWLVFSFIGYDQQEILIKDAVKIDVTLKESEQRAVDEVVVTALGRQRKATVTGAITTVDVSTLKTSTSSITNALAGNVAGVLAMQSSGQPGSNTSEFWIRGISTFGAGTSALVLVDGFERSLDEINIEDIETFTVLKDASTTAIYGSRGANGVVLITTKKGKMDKVSINAKHEASYNTRTFTPEFVDGYTYAKLMNEARTTRNEEPFYSNQDLTLIRNQLDPDLFPDINWMDMFLKPGAFTQRTSLNFDGGGALARYFVSGSYIDEGGMYETDENLKNYNTNANYKRWNYRANVDMNLTKTTLVRMGVSGSLGKQNLPGGTYREIWASLMGQNPISIPIKYSTGQVASRGGAERQNPWVLITQQGYIENWDNKVQTNVTLEQDLKFVTPGLRFVGRFGYDNNNKNYIRRMKWPEGWLAERQRESNGELRLRRTIAEQLLVQTSDASGDRLETLQGEMHYRKTINNDHSIGAIVQYTQEKKVNTSRYDTDIMQGIERRNQRLAGRFTYGYQSRYFFDVNFGYNGSENFATGHQFGLFPAVSGAWNIAEEKFVRDNLTWMNMFKIRYSYGKVGNDIIRDNNNNPIRFPYLASFGTNTEAGYNWGDIESRNIYSGLTYSRIASNSITWEVSTKHDLGLDFSLFGDKFSGALDYFHERRDGIYMERQYVPDIVGLMGQDPRANVGATLSKGFDGQMKYTQKINNLSLTARGTMTYSKNEILEADEEFSNYPYTNRTGFRVNQNRGLVALGLFNDYDDIRNSPIQNFGRTAPGDIKYKDINGDGTINNDDVVPVGATRYPNLVYGFGLSASWNGLDASVLFQGAGKSSFFIDGFTVYPFSSGDWGNILTDVAESNRWILGENEDPNAVYPRLSYAGSANNYRNSTYWLRESSYLRIKTVDLGYTFSRSLASRLGLKTMRLYFLGTNLLTFSKFKMWDPEMNSTNGQAYPLAKSYTLGLTVNL
ncbi:SusC/RagA family TonB-linked outer membrane protein [Sphingobacterium pedocola]|uniref:SusC/RagA family protein n=1 Tax=Sphingobacterium pedocola TaxID=2082722 RepID=A0ABR9T8P8_9SPHI|nr:TonB-dependent receptor [Sphingobacterium pedocola]MBE8721709.1 SusC/RagA family protein [Sphingobacterium pedocola]